MGTISTLWKPNLAYIIGLLTTDGNLSKDGRHICMRSSDSEKHIKWLYGIINKLSKIKGSLQCNIKPYPKVPIWEIKFSKKDSLKLLRWIYYQPDLPCLERKHKLALKILDIIPKQRRKIYTLVSKID
jgi:hypothetical protein